MSTTQTGVLDGEHRQASPSLNPGFKLWFRQLGSITRLEISKSLFSKRTLLVCVLASIPALVIALYGIFHDQIQDPHEQSIEQSRQIFAYLYSGMILGAVVFLGCAAVFTTLFRGEILDRSIHYYLLAPVRREILVVGKFIAGLTTAFVLFGLTTIASYLLLYLPFGATRLVTDLSSGIVLVQLAAYLGITFLACIGYGALFMFTGLLFRNPLLPVVFVATWEVLHFILPPALKMFSVIYYLKGLLPLSLDEGPFAIIVSPLPLWESILGLVVLAAIALTGTQYILKRLEVKYTED